MEIKFNEEIIQEYSRRDHHLEECIPGGIAKVDVRIDKELMKKLLEKLFSLSRKPIIIPSGVLSPLDFRTIPHLDGYPDFEEAQGYLVGKIKRGEDSLSVEIDNFLIYLYLIDNSGLSWIGSIPILDLSTYNYTKHVSLYAIYDVRQEKIQYITQRSPFDTVEPDVELNPLLKFSGDVFSNVEGIIGTFHTHPIVFEVTSKCNAFPSCKDVDFYSSFLSDLPFPKIFMILMFPFHFASLAPIRTHIPPEREEKFAEDLYNILFRSKFRLMESPMIIYLKENPVEFFKRPESYHEFWRGIVEPFDHKKITEAFLRIGYTTRKSLKKLSKLWEVSEEELMDGGYLRCLLESIQHANTELFGESYLRNVRTPEGYKELQNLEIFQRMREIGTDERYFLPLIVRKINLT